MKVHVSLDIALLHSRLLEKKKYYVTPEELSRDLAISVQSAGRVLKKMCEKGLAEKWSKNVYRLLATRVKTA